MTLLLLTACGGIPDGKKLGKLTDDELFELCTELGPASVECDGIDITIGDADTCAELTADAITDECTFTAGDYRKCNEALHEDPCDVPLSCIGLYACLDTTITLD